MTKQTFESQLQAAERYIQQADPILAPYVARYGPCTIRPHRNYYEALVSEIIGQQLHVKAAAHIRARFIVLFGGNFPEPATLLTKNIEELRTAGLSKSKALYIHDLATHIVDRRVRFDTLDNLDNAAVIEELTRVKGIGEWTAHMFLMFCMGRLDVLARGDLGIRLGIQALYSLKTAPTPEQVMAIAKEHHWHPYETVACWYVWASRDNKPL
jgi:DNA-3-methyladenine glycosylase II